MFFSLLWPLGAHAVELDRCGTYLVQGELRLLGLAKFELLVNPRSESEYRVGLSGGPPADVVGLYAGKRVQVELSIHRPAQGYHPEARLERVVAVLPDPQVERPRAFTRLREADCR